MNELIAGYAMFVFFLYHIPQNVTRHVSLYELLGLERRREVCCIRLCQPENSDFNFSVETTDQGYILVDDPKDQDLNHGDRYFEISSF